MASSLTPLTDASPFRLLIPQIKHVDVRNHVSEKIPQSLIEVSAMPSEPSDGTELRADTTFQADARY